MKKVLASITLICYLALTCGVVVNFHYCMNRLASVQFFGTEAKVCGKCGMHTEDSNGCCRDEVKVIMMDEDQQKAQAVFLLQAPQAEITIPSAFIVIPSYNIVESCHWHNHSPPLLSGQDTYLQNGVFRI